MLELLPGLLWGIIKHPADPDPMKARMMSDFGFKTGWDSVEGQIQHIDGDWYFGDTKIVLEECAFAVRRSWLRDRIGTIYEIPRIQNPKAWRDNSRISPQKAHKYLGIMRPPGLYPLFTYETFAGWPNKMVFGDEASCILGKCIIDDLFQTGELFDEN